jgi:outer membrane protein assembly factor BamB
MKMNALLLSILAIYASCMDPDPMWPEPHECQMDSVITKIKSKWQAPIQDIDTARQLITQSILYGGNIIYARILNNRPNSLIMRNAETGVKIWESIDPDFLFISTKLDNVVYNNKIYYFHDAGRSGNEILAVDLTNGNVIYRKNIDKFDIRISSFGNKVYYKTFQTNVPDTDSVTMWEFDLDNYNTRKLFTVYKKDGYSPSLESTICYLNSDGDTILFCQNRQLGTIDLGRIGVLAYNITQSKYLWQHEDIDYLMNSTIHPAIFYEGRVYFKGGAMLYCYNAFTGEEIWSKDVSSFTKGDMVLGNFLIEENLVIVHCNHGTVVAYEAESGNMKWFVTESADTINGMVYYNGKIYLDSGADGYLHSINIRTGQKEWKEISPNTNCFKNASFGTCYLTIDSQSGLLYASDKYFMICINLNK